MLTKLIAFMLLFWQIVMLCFYATNIINIYIALIPLWITSGIVLFCLAVVVVENVYRKKETKQKKEFYRGAEKKQGWNYWVNENN